MQVFGKQRAQRAIGEARSQDGAFAGATLATEERTGDLASGVHALFVIDAKGEKIDARAGRRRHGGGRQDQRIAQAGCDGAAGLPGQLAGGKGELLVAYLRGKLL